jgi:hypothetical protein
MRNVYLAATVELPASARYWKPHRRDPQFPPRTLPHYRQPIGHWSNAGIVTRYSRRRLMLGVLDRNHWLLAQLDRAAWLETTIQTGAESLVLSL